MNMLLDRRTFAGLILVVVGLALLVAQWLTLTDAAVLGSIGAAFLVAYAMTRHYGFLVPGMILAGAAVGTGVQDSGKDPTGGLVAIACGAGFLAIYAVDLFVRGPARWWPVVPGAILVLLGAYYVTEGTVVAEVLARAWPLVIVTAGAILLFAAWRRAPTTRESAKPA